MNAYAAITMVGLVVYCSLLVVTMRDRRTRVRRLFGFYLLVAMVWGLGTFLLCTDFLGQSRLWAGFVVLGGICMIIAYYDFVCTFVHKKRNVAVRIGYGLAFAVVLPLVALGYIPESVSVSSGVVQIKYGPLLYLITAISVPNTSMCLCGHSDTLPRCFAVGSPSRYAAYACAASCMVIAGRIRMKLTT